MNTYEGMFLVDSKLDEEKTEAVFGQIKDAIVKNGGNIISSHVWANKRKLCYPIKRSQEATYYLANFKLLADSVDKIRQAYRLNENILRFFIIKTQ